MIVNMLLGSKYKYILDYGSGPGIFTKELHRHSSFVSNYDVPSYDLKTNKTYKFKFDVVVCASVLEFCENHNLDEILEHIKSLINQNGFLIVASPLDSIFSKFYLNLIRDKNKRNSCKDVIHKISNKFKITKYKEWMGLYYCLKATPI